MKANEPGNMGVGDSADAVASLLEVCDDEVKNQIAEKLAAGGSAAVAAFTLIANAVENGPNE